MKSFYLTKLIILVLALPIFGQGSFIIDNYSNKDYGGHRQVWSITQDSSGNTLFGNSQGVLLNDGVRWQSFHISRNTSIIRSLKTDSKGRVFYGAQDDFGEIIFDSLNQIKSISFYDEVLDRDKPFGDIWRIQIQNGLVYFQSNEKVFAFDGDSLVTIESEYRVSQLSNAGGELFIRLINNGLAKIQGYNIYYINGSEGFSNTQMFTADLVDQKVFFGTSNNGVIIFENRSFFKPNLSFQSYFENYPIYRSVYLGNRKIAYGTLGGGILILDVETYEYQIIDESNGLIDNQIYELYYDQEVLWVATDDGISKILISVPIEVLSNQNDEFENVVDIKKIDDYYFALTTEDAYSFFEKEYESTHFGLYQPKKILEYDNKALVSSSLGLFLLEGKGDKKQLTETNFSDFINYRYDGKEFISGIYEGNILFGELKNEKLDLFQTIVQDESLEFVAFFNDRTWATNKNGVIYSYSPDAKIEKKYDLKLKSSGQVQFLEVINDSLRLGTNIGLFQYDLSIDSFEYDSEFDKTPDQKTKQVFRMAECPNKEYWAIINRDLFFYSNEAIKKSPFQIIGDGEEINAIFCDEELTWFGGSSGIYILKKANWDYKTNFKTNITSIYIHNDSLIYGGFGEPVDPILLPYEDNEMRFTYAAASYIDETRNTYSYKLEGFDENWSPWSLETQKDYTNLPEGDYVFKVKSRNVYEVDGKMDQLSFSILPPWYRTWWAYFMYTILITGILYTAFKIRVNQILKIERMRTRIANDLHDDVSATLTGISLFAEAVQRDKDPKKRSYFMDRITESAGDAKENITDIVWAINPENDQWEEFLIKCRRYASDLMESKEIEYTLHIAEQIPGKLKMDVRQHLWMIFKEMLTNVVRHSQAERVDVILDVENGILKLIVQDNGIGFREKKKTGNGLLNIRKRAERIKGKLHLKTDKEFGTRWRLELPL